MKSIKLTAFSLLLLLTLGLGCSGAKKGAPEAITLNIWGVFDDEDYYDEVIDDYRFLHPNLTIKFREFRFEEYQNELVRALAEGEGPDIFLVHNTWMREYQSLMRPLPESLTLDYLEVRGQVKKETVTVTKTDATLSERDFASKFVDAIAEDAILSYQPDPDEPAEEKIFGLPTHLDTLALFWNKDLLNASSIAEPPENWESFQDAVTKLTKIDATGSVVQSGAALGTSENVERSADLLALLMMQNGTAMTDEDGRAAFDQIPEGEDREELPGLDAVRFYTDFANPTKAVYGWNADLPDSFDAFTGGTAALLFGYSYHLPLIRTASPKLNFAVAPLPQIEGGRQVNFASYWLMTVSKDSKYWNYAWDFIQFMTAEEQENAKYLEAANKPPALRSLIASQLENPDLAPFASQTLTAKTWYQGRDVDVTEAALRELIDNVLNATLDPIEAIELAAEKVTQTL